MSLRGLAQAAELGRIQLPIEQIYCADHRNQHPTFRRRRRDADESAQCRLPGECNGYRIQTQHIDGQQGTLKAAVTFSREG